MYSIIFQHLFGRHGLKIIQIIINRKLLPSMDATAACSPLLGLAL
jgi:hypothetical protein